MRFHRRRLFALGIAFSTNSLRLPRAPALVNVRSPFDKLGRRSVHMQHVDVDGPFDSLAESHRLSSPYSGSLMPAYQVSATAYSLYRHRLQPRLATCSKNMCVYAAAFMARVPDWTTRPNIAALQPSFTSAKTKIFCIEAQGTSCRKEAPIKELWICSKAWDI